MCFVLCDDAADVDANADAMNCFFFILSAPLFASSVHTSARSSTIPSKENIQQMFTDPIFLGVHTLRCDFSRYNWRFFFSFCSQSFVWLFQTISWQALYTNVNDSIIFILYAFLKKKKSLTLYFCAVVVYVLNALCMF